MKFQKQMRICMILFVVLISTMIIALCAGRYTMNLNDISNAIFQKGLNSQVDTVVWNIRLPRIIMSVLIGAGLSVSGVCLQAMFGNPLVSAHTLGVSYSAGFGAALGILIFNNFLYIQVLATLMGFLGMFITYRMSRKNGQSSILMLVLSGVIVGAVFEALTSLIKFVADPEQKLPAITYWLMGSMAGTSWSDILKAVPFVVVSIAILWLLRWRLNVISLSEDEAISLGINIRQTRILIIITTTVIASVAVSFCGVIAFVGLAVPHLMRMLCGNDHRVLLTANFLGGGIFLLVIDTLARSATATEIPLSILTAVVGAPIFAILLHKTGGVWND